MTATRRKLALSSHQAEPERPRIKASAVQPGHLLAIVHWVRVKGTQRNGEELRVQPLDGGDDFSVIGRDLVECCQSADLFTREASITRTEIQETLLAARNTPLTVCWDKSSGETRVLRGRLVNSAPKNGFSMVEDLDKARGDRLRQVDHRTLRWLIVDGVKYTVR